MPQVIGISEETGAPPAWLQGERANSPQTEQEVRIEPGSLEP